MSQSRSFTSVQPTGTISYFANSSAPNGWLKCDGAAISRTSYSDLFTVISTNYGSGDGLNTFNVPDLRSEFLRGYDDGRGVDAGRVFANTQGDAIRNITGTFPTAASLNSNTRYSGAFAKSAAAGFSGNGGDPQTNYLSTMNVALQLTTSTEYRPRNVALLTCIKY